MIFSKNAIFPYPVLKNELDDYTENIFNLEDLSFNDFLLIPFLIPVADVWFNWNRLIWEFKILKFKFIITQINVYYLGMILQKR